MTAFYMNGVYWILKNGHWIKKVVNRSTEAQPRLG